MTLTQIIVFPSPTGSGLCDFAMVNPKLDVAEVREKLFSEHAEYFITTNEELPVDIYYRNSWMFSPGKITMDIIRMKEIAHNIRRQRRSAELKPYDNIIAAQIPGGGEQAELKRVEIRAKYVAIQEAIDNATSYADLPLEVKSQ
jgi:hypothetical protein